MGRRGEANLHESGVAVVLEREHEVAADLLDELLGGHAELRGAGAGEARDECVRVHLVRVERGQRELQLRRHRQPRVLAVHVHDVRVQALQQQAVHRTLLRSCALELRSLVGWWITMYYGIMYCTALQARCS